MKTKLFLLASVVALALCSCNREKPYTINGTLDLPDQIAYGDTMIDIPSFEGTMVYLLNLDNEQVDSAEIVDNSFKMSGMVRPKEPYYMQFVSQLGSSLIAIEPGEIDIEITANEIIVSGTTSNDAMSDVDAIMENLNNDTYAYFAHLTDSLKKEGLEMTYEQQLRMAQEFQNTMDSQLDSAYQENKDNLGGPYAVMMRLVYCESSELYESAISQYPEEIQNNELIQLNLRMLKQYEMSMGGGYDFANDSLMLKPEELGY